MLGVSRRVGLPCRADVACREVFTRPRMSSDYAVLCAAAADRNEHELAAHGFVYSPPAERSRPPFAAAFAHARAVHQRGGRARWAKGAS